MMKKMKTSDRYVVEDGVCVIRELNHNGKPMPTERERLAIIDHYEPIIMGLLKARNESYKK